MTERPSLTDEQLRQWTAPTKEAGRIRTELIALRAERAKPTQSDEERASALAEYINAWWSNDDDDAATPTQRALSAFASIRAEGSAERAALEAALELEHEETKRLRDMAFTLRAERAKLEAVAAAMMASRDAWRARWRALAQPAESGATDSWSMHMAHLEETNGDPEISGGLHLAKPTEQQCDCCGQLKECENVVAFGLDTTACEECRDAGAKP